MEHTKAKHSVDNYSTTRRDVFVPPRPNCGWSRANEDGKRAALAEEVRLSLARKYKKLSDKLRVIEEKLGPRVPSKPPPPPSLGRSGGQNQRADRPHQFLTAPCSENTLVHASELVSNASRDCESGLLVAKDEYGNLLVLVGPKVGGSINLTYCDSVARLSRRSSYGVAVSEIPTGIAYYGVGDHP